MSDKKHYDAIVVGAGAAGGVFINRLARAGLKVLAIEKGPFYRDHKNDFFESELAIFKLLWDNNQYRVSGTAFRGTPNLGKAVGGGTLAWTAVALRFFDRDFTFADRWGHIPGTSVSNWPVRLADLERFYDMAEIDMGVSGNLTIWDAPSTEAPPNPPIPFYRSSLRYQQGFDRLGLNWAPGRIATNSVSYEGRAACLHCGFCRAGCRIDAKYQADKVLIEPALATGNVELVTESVVTRVHTNDEGDKATGVSYKNVNTLEEFTADGKVVIVCNNPIEIPRLLLASANMAHPDGIGNRFDQVGRNFFTHLGIIGFGTTDEDLRMSVGQNMANIMSLDTAENTEDPSYAGGFTLLGLNGAGAGVAALDPMVDINGGRLKEVMAQYNRSLMLLSFVEGVPVEENRITLSPNDYDEFGMPRAHVNFDYHDNDLKALKAAQDKVAQVLYASDANEVFVSPEFEAHPMGTMRMGTDPSKSVTNPMGRVHGVENLYVGGSAVFVTGGSVNPTLTLHALALRTTEHILDEHFHEAQDEYIEEEHLVEEEH